MEFRILGPLEVVESGQTLELGGQKQRLVLAMLLLAPNRVVSQDRLIEALWEEEPPARAQKSLQVYVSQLRKVLGRERLETRAPGYLLRVEDGELDLDSFRRLVEQNHPPEALSLWRGPPLADFRYLRFAQAEIARLEELRLACLEARVESDLRRGRHAELVGELEALVGEHPFREQLRSQLMLALYRCGRQAEALEVYQGARRELVEELGIEPSKSLRDLHQAILNQDPALDLVPEQRALAELRGGFVGRERELAQLSGALDEAFAGRGSLFLLEGEPGIGKSRLAEELTSQARGRRVRVLVGRCWEAGGAPAYWPWTQSLRSYLREVDAAAVRRQLGDGAAEVAHIAPELRELLPDLPAASPGESEAARFRLFDSTARFLEHAAVEHPIVIVLDDLHAADEPSLLLLSYLASVLGDTRLLVIGTFRDVDPTVHDPLESTLAELSREPAMQRIHLSGLSESEVGLLVQVTAGNAPGERLVAELYVETEGNPLFVSEIVRLLAAEGRLGRGAGGQIPVPASVRETIGRRLGRLSGECRRVLSLASVLGREFGLVALERVADYTGIDKLLSVLDEALRARVVEDTPGGLARLRFGHALIRDVLYEEIPATHRIRLHRRVAEVLEELYAGNPGPHLAELAHHFTLAVPAGSREKAVEYARRAGDQAVARLAFEEAVHLYEGGLELVEDERTRCELLLALGDAQARAGNTPTSKARYREAAELAQTLGAPEVLARAALGYGGRIVWEASRDDPYLVPLLEGALDAIGDEDTPLRVKLLARLGGGPLRDASFPQERRVALTEEALDRARRIGEPATLAYALAGYLPAHHSPDYTPRQVERATELIDLALKIGDLERAVEGYEHRGPALLELGDSQGAKADYEAMAELAARLRQPAQDWFVGEVGVFEALLEGRFDEAERLIPDVLAMGQLAQRWSASISYRLQLYLLRRSQGRPDEFVRFLEERPREFQYPTYPIWKCVLASVYEALGRRPEARALLEDLAADDFACVPFDEEWLVSMSLLAELVCSLRDLPRSAVLYDRLLPYAERVAVAYSEISTGSVARSLGLLAGTLECVEEAARHFEAALEINERIGARPWLAHTQEDYGRLLLERGETKRGSELIASALASYRELGMDSHTARTQELVEAYA